MEGEAGEAEGRILIKVIFWMVAKKEGVGLGLEIPWRRVGAARGFKPRVARTQRDCLPLSAVQICLSRP